MKGLVVLEFWDKELRLWFSETKGKEVIFDSKVYKNDALSGAVKGQGILGQPAILIVPRNLVTVRFIEVPSIEQEEIKEMVEFQAQKELPFSKEEIVAGFRNLGSYREGYSWVLIAIGQKDKLYEKIRFVESVGLKVSKVSLSTEFLFLWARELVNEGIPNLILDIDKEDSELLIIDSGRLVFSRAFSNEVLLEEIGRSIEVYKREKIGGLPEEGIITGGFKNLKDISKSIESNLNIKTRILDFNVNPQVFNLLEIDLTSPEIRESRGKELKKKDLIYYLTLSSIILFLIFGLIGLRLFYKEKFILALDKKLKSIESEAIEVERIIKKITIAQSYTKQKGSAVFCLSELYKVIPENVSLIRISFDESKMVLQGSSKDMSYILKFISALEESSAFYKAELKSATKRSSSRGEFTDFQIICLLEP